MAAVKRLALGLALLSGCGDGLKPAAFEGVPQFTIEGTLNYKWRWELIPGYIVGYHTGREEYFANLLLQGLVATIRISIYASILALIFGTILGIARCSSNLTVRMLARTYLEFLRNIPPVANLIRTGRWHQIYATLEANRKEGLVTLERHLVELARAREITLADARRFANDPTMIPG